MYFTKPIQALLLFFVLSLFLASCPTQVVGQRVNLKSTNASSDVNRTNNRNDKGVITFTALPSKKVGDAPFLLLATSTNSGSPINFRSSSAAIATVALTAEGWKATIVSAGMVTITASQSAGNGFAAANSESQLLVVEEAVSAPTPAPVVPAVITFAPLPTKKVGDPAFLLQATSTNLNSTFTLASLTTKKSGLGALQTTTTDNQATPITYTSSNPAVATVVLTAEGWMANITGAGSTSITASQTAGNGFSAAANVSQTLIVEAAAPIPVPSVITFAALTPKKVGEPAFTLVATSTNTTTPIIFSSSNTAVVSVSNASGRWMATVMGAGTATITASQVAGNGFTAATSVSQTQIVSSMTASVISFPALAGKTVGDAPIALSATSSNTITPITFTSSNNAVVSVSNASGRWMATIVGAGTASITASQAAGNGFTAAANVSQSLTVRTATVAVPSVITFAGLTAKNLGDPAFQLQATSTNLITPITFTSSNAAVVSVSNATGRWMATIVGTGTATITASQVAGNGFAAAANVSQVQTIGAAAPAPVLAQAVITFNSLPGKIVGDAPFALVATSTNTTTPITFTSSNPAVVSLSNASGRWMATVMTSGSANITASQAASSTFLAAANVVRVQTVNPAVITAPVVPSAYLDVDPALKSGNEANRVHGTVPIDKYDVYNMNNTRYLDALVDGNTEWVEYGHGMLLQVAETYFDVRDYHVKLSQLKIFNNSFGDYGVEDAEWYYVPKGKFPKDKVLLGKHRGKPYLQFSNFPEVPFAEPVEISWIIRKGPTYMPREVSIVGSYIPKPSKVYDARPKKPFATQLGNNSFVWDFVSPTAQNTIVPAKLEAAKSFLGGFRFYMDAHTIEANREQYTFNPTSHGWWNYDVLFASLKANNLPALACIRGQSGPMQLSYPADIRDLEKVPVYNGANFEDPASYKENAQLGFQTAARYGTGLNADGSDRTQYLLTKAKVQNAKYTNSTGDVFHSVNTVKVGLGSLTYIQHDNERDKWWKGREGYQTGREYAANMSAFYDGHKGALGPGVGVKDADPNMKVVTTGIALANTYYYQGMLDWCREFRGYKKDRNGNLLLDRNGAAIVDFPADIIAFHNYFNNAGQQHMGTRGVAPEIGGIETSVGRFVKFAREELPGVELWQTETGYDTRSTSSQAAIAIGTKSQDITQADWNLRIALLNWKLGVDRTMYYMLYDTPLNTSWDLYTRSGFLNNDQTRRPAADFFKQAGSLLGNFIYNRTLNADPYIIEGVNGSDKIYACWIPDEVGRTGTYQLDLGAAAYAYIYTPKAGSDVMSMQKVPTQAGKVTINVTETPIFVKTTEMIAVASSQTMKVEEELGLMKLYPNPTNDNISLELQNEDVSNPVNVKISSMNSGKLYHTFNFEKKTHQFVQKLDIESLPAGGYVIEVMQGERKEVKKFFKLQ